MNWPSSLSSAASRLATISFTLVPDLVGEGPRILCQHAVSQWVGKDLADVKDTGVVDGAIRRLALHHGPLAVDDYGGGHET